VWRGPANDRKDRGPCEDRQENNSVPRITVSADLLRVWPWGALAPRFYRIDELEEASRQ
jgi:hypothetical protein